MDYINLEFFNGIWLSIKWLYFLPGDLLVSCLSKTDIGRFYEFSDADREGAFSFFVPWFFVAFLMASIDDTKSGRLIFFNKGKKTLTKNGRKRAILFFIALLVLISAYLVLQSLDVKNSWIDLLFVIFSVFTVWYVLLTNGYSFKKKKFRKVQQILTKRGKKDIIKALRLPAILLVLYLASTFISYSCSFVIFLIPVLFVVFYFSIGNRRKKLKNNFIKVYKNIKLSFKK
jgi:protein-S-isoprenylcysteine O-methyltransferase Ste14